MKSVTYSVPAIHCEHCIHTVEMELGEVPGVQSVKANLEAKNVVIGFDEPASEEVLKQTLSEIDYPVAA